MGRVNIIFACLFIIFIVKAADQFDITKTGKDGTLLYQTVCNVQTTLEFQFSSETKLPAAGSTNQDKSKLFFLHSDGTDLNLTLSAASFQLNTDYVKGYGQRAKATLAYEGAFMFQFTQGLYNVYVFVPVTTSSTKNPDLIATSPAAISSFVDGSSLSAFNVLDETDYNLWYTASTGKTTILVSNFVYNIKALPAALGGGTVTLPSVWDIASTGDKLCYASTLTTQNFQTHIRQSLPLWFIWFFILFFWLFYLISDSTNLKIYDKHYANNIWTCISWYSIANLAHEEYFTRLSRTTVLLINWTLQGVFIASIYGNQLLGSPMIIWTAVVAFVATMPFPFIWGELIFKKIYKTNETKFENMKLMKGTIDKEKIEPFETKVDQCQQKLYGYYHWFYAIAVVFLFICWPIAINQMQRLPRTHYYYHWYWLASMGVTMGLEYLIYEPLLALLFGDRQIVRNRGGFFFKAKLSQLHRAAQSF